MAVAACFACSNKTITSDPQLDPELYVVLKRALEQSHARGHGRRVAVGTRAIALARLVNARRHISGSMREMLDAEVRFLWASSCLPFLNGLERSIPKQIENADLAVLDSLPSSVVMIDCHHAFLADHGRSLLVYKSGSWRVANF